MSTRVQLQQAINEAVDESARAGTGIDVDNLALTLSSTYQQSGFTITQIVAEIRSAVTATNAEAMRQALSYTG